MKRYGVLAWDPANALAASKLEAVRQQARRAPTWRLLEPMPGLMLALETPRPLAVRPILGRPGWVIGDLYETSTFRTAAGELSLPGDERAATELLFDCYWGRYVALWRAGDRLSVARDPGGALEAVRWRAWGVDVVASTRAGPWAEGLAAPIAIDWEEVAHQLQEPLRAHDTLALKGVAATSAGTLWPATRTPLRLWTPAKVVRDARRDGRPRIDDGAELAAVVDGCVGAMGRASGRLAAELSGGLDSAIVASALTRAGDGDVDVAAWINVRAAEPESDERPMARCVASWLGLAVTEMAKSDFAYALEALAAQPLDWRPSLSALDHAHDAAMAALIGELGVDSLMTGQGGDAVFLQMVTPLALCDGSAALSGPGRWLGEALAIARGSRQSVWSVARRAALGGFAAERPVGSSLLAKSLRAPARRPRHAWLEDLDDVPPAKALHIRALAYAQAAHGGSLRARRADQLHPLLAQPLLETCLALPVSVLTAGGRGRALARSAFSERLPRAILERRAKGDLTAHYGRAIGRSLAALRPFLLDGRLAKAGLLDGAALEAALTAEQLISVGAYAAIQQLMVMEIWARRWP
ncbi:asparagine synthase-related protein [Phenylobacterium sp.]|uniref:asparagine synthase-related protein n=1 Tax=Phenylobacterium sp. TaxID=1871053 RepID=UPI0035AF412A